MTVKFLVKDKCLTSQHLNIVVLEISYHCLEVMGSNLIQNGPISNSKIKDDKQKKSSKYGETLFEMDKCKFCEVLDTMMEFCTFRIISNLSLS